MIVSEISLWGAAAEDVTLAARESSAKAEAEKRRRLQDVAREIEEWRSKTAK